MYLCQFSREKNYNKICLTTTHIRGIIELH